MIMKSSPAGAAGIKTTLSVRVRRLAWFAGLGLLLFYALGVSAGYVWLRYVRKNDQIGFVDVALFRVAAVRRGIAAQHFTKAQVEWDAKNYQAAYLYFSAAVRQDPANVPGRLAAARFLRSVGAGNLGLIMLEEGLDRAPDDRRLIETTFDFLAATGQNRRLLDLLRKHYGSGLSGPNGALLQRYEVGATLAVEGVPAAKLLLERHGDLLRDPQAAPTVARVRWESQERLKAIGLLQEYVRTQPAAYADYALLAGWQEAGGLTSDAVRTAERACAKFPAELGPRVLLIEMLNADSPGGSAMQQGIAAYLRSFAGRPESLAELAALAGRKGWVDLARTLYEIGANRQPDLSRLALCYCDALMHNSQFKEVRQLLAQIEAQAPESSASFMIQLRQRQVITAAAAGDHDGAREHARRLAAVLHGDAEGIEACSRIFQKLGITEAVAELSGRPAIAAVKK
jgi:tetratricopeptide (TPR) repeat protein